jgi:CRISPR-associated protein Csd1
MEDFWEQVKSASAATQAPALAAILAFRGGYPATPPFLRWGPKAGSTGKSAWWITTASGSESKLAPANFSFRVAGALPLEDPALQEFWRHRHAAELAAADAAAERGICLITGDPAALLATTHDPAIRGIRGAQATGAKLVSFEKSAPAFNSYGREQALNAPAGISAARSYATALQWLTSRPDHHLHLGPGTTCFWARESEAATGLFARLLRRPDPLAVAQFLRAPWSGLDRPPAEGDQFFALSLGGNGGRLVVRDWLQVPLAQAAENIQRWFADLKIDGPPPHPKAPPPLAISELARCAAPLKTDRSSQLTPDEEKLPPGLPGQLYAAALSGSAPALSLVGRLLGQLHSRLLRDGSFRITYDRSRFALLKLTLNRNRGPNMEIPPALAANTTDPAYNAGRLLAVLHSAQAKAHEFDLKGASVAERYFGAASTSPATVFPLLLRLNRHHLKKIAGSERYGSHSRFIEEQIRAILARFAPAQPGAAPEFPRLLDLHAQGRFALGFYQQAAADAAARKAASGGPAEEDPAALESESKSQD